MPLAAATLRQAMRSLFDSNTMPTGDPLGDWMRAYVSYAQSGIAGPVALAQDLVVGSGPFTLDVLDAALRTMWTAAVWAGPGVTAVTSLVPPVQPLLLAIAPTLNASYDVELAPTLIAEALHTYTLSVVVTVTPATGAPFPATVA